MLSWFRLRVAFLLGIIILLASGTLASSGDLQESLAPDGASITIEVPLAASADDAGMDYFNCEYKTNHPEVYFGECSSGAYFTPGFRFSGVQLPRNAQIQNAYIRFQVDGFYSDQLEVELRVEDAVHAQPFSFSSRPENRPLVPGLAARWSILSGDSWSLGVYRDTPPVTALVQNIVDRPGWNPGNAIAIIAKNIGPSVGPWRARRVLAYDRAGSAATKLVVTYTNPEATPNAVVARRASMPPTIDGDLREWYALSSVYLDRYNASAIEKEWPDPWDNSIYLRVAWDPGYLYFGGVIYDDRLVGNNSEKPWGDDSLELGVYSPAAGTAQFTAAVDGRQAYKGANVTAMTFVTSTIPGGWLIEGAIPTSSIGFGSLQAGQSMPFNFALWDDDLRAVWGQSHMYWRSNSTTEAKPDWGALDLSASVWDVAPTPPTPTPTPTPSPTPPALGALRGAVWHDVNHDGMRGPDELGLVGVRIRLLAGGSVIGETTTSGAGEYEFGSLLPGAYSLLETQPTWLKFSSTPDLVSVLVVAGESKVVNFGDWTGVPSWLPLLLSR
jgi:hypothetical protein